MAAAAHPATSPHRNSCRRFPARCLAPARRPNGWPILPWLLRRLQRLALLLRDAPLQLRPEMPDKPLDGPGGGVAEGADCVAFDLLGDVEQRVDLVRLGIAFAKALHDAPHPPGAHPTGGALAAGRERACEGKRVWVVVVPGG